MVLKVGGILVSGCGVESGWGHSVSGHGIKSGWGHSVSGRGVESGWTLKWFCVTCGTEQNH